MSFLAAATRRSFVMRELGSQDRLYFSATCTSRTRAALHSKVSPIANINIDEPERPQDS